MRRSAVLVCWCVLGAAAAAAQVPAPPPQTIDRIVAVVGVRAILMSEVEEQLVLAQADAQSKGQPFPTDSTGLAKLRRQILNQMVEEELFVEQAQRDTSIKVTEQEVLDQVEQTVQNVRRGFASEMEFQRQLKLANFGSVEEWRRFLGDQQRRGIMRQRLIESLRQKGKLRPIPPTDAQMRAFWEENKSTVQQRPEVVSFRQIVITPQPDSTARAETLRRADSLLAALRGGADFGDLARSYSKDTATAANGGELGWFRRGVMVKAFENAVFRLRPGELSEPVETEYGFHIIQLERAQPAEVLARHILLTPTISAAQIDIAHRLADSVRARLLAGATLDSLARAYGDPNEPKLAEAVAISQLPQDYQQAIGSDTALGVKPVFTVAAGSARPKFVVLDLTQRLAAGDVNFDDVKDQIRQQLGQQLAYQHYLDQLRRQTYIDIRL